MDTVRRHLTLRNAAVFIAALLVLLGIEHQWSIHRTLNRLAGDPMGAVIGPAAARNTIVEFMDYDCSGCRVFNATLEQFAQMHPDVRIVIRHDPVSDDAIHGAQLALAAARQGRFQAMHDILASRDTPLPTAEIPPLAQQLGLDVSRLEKDVKDRAFLRHMEETEGAMAYLGIRRTPNFIINGTIYDPGPGPVPDLSRFEAVYGRLAR